MKIDHFSPNSPNSLFTSSDTKVSFVRQLFLSGEYRNQMSQDFQKVLVKDDRLNVTDAVQYAVHKGGQNMTPATFQAISQTPSSVTFNIQVNGCL
jgi:hypothetical protein